MKKTAIIIIIFLLFSTGMSVYAENKTDESASKLAELQDGLDDEIKDGLSSLGIDVNSYETILSADINSYFSLIKEFFVNGLKKPLSAFAMGSVIILMLSVFSGFWNKGKVMSDVYSYMAMLSVTSIVLMPFISTVSACVNSLKAAGVFMLSFAPVFAGILLLSGKVTSAAVYGSLSIAAVNGITYGVTYIVSPIVGIYLCFGITSVISGIDGAYNTAKRIKSCVTWILGLITTLFSAFVTVQSIVSKGADNLAIKTTKFFIGSSIPVAGSALSDALTTVTASIGVLRASALGWCIILIILYLLPSFLTLMAWRLAFFLLSAVSNIMSTDELSKIFDICSAVAGLMIAVILTVFVMFVISLVICAL